MAKRILGIVSGKGGVGKTTVAVNLGVLAASAGFQTILVDGDIANPSIGLHLGMLGYTDGLQKVLAGKCNIEEALIVHPMSGLRCLPATFGDEVAEGMKGLKRVLEKAKYENVILDTPPGISSNVRDMVSACTEIVVVVTPDMSSTLSAAKMCKMAEKLGVKVHGVVINRIQNRKYEMHWKEVEATCEQRVLAMIGEDRAVPESIGAHVPVVMQAPRSPASMALRELASALDFEPKKGYLDVLGIGDLIKKLLLKLIGRR
ncbi:MAG: MinD/ParA family protein [Candidatus Micrarchaeia archaeon]|jgi:septum site-determining protein MinD